MKKTTVFILSSGHSGSTLLGAFLHAHPQVMHLGEITAPVYRRLRQDYPYECMYCGNQPCPVWHDLLSEKFVQYCYAGYWLNNQGYQKSWRKYLYRGLAYWQTLRGAAGRPGELFNYLFTHAPHVDVIVDSSKHTEWAIWNSRNPNFRTVYIFLWRDLRALVAGNLRRKLGDLTSSAETVAHKRHELLALRDSLPVSAHFTLQYETLATHPAQVGQQLCAFLGLDFRSEMLEFYKVQHHIWGGNPSIVAQALRFHNEDPWRAMQTMRTDNRSYYEQNPALGFKLDDRWKNELTDGMLAHIEPIIGAANRRSGYDS